VDNEAKKRVLVVGADSYIGDSFAKFAQDRLYVDIVDSYEGWKAASFEAYDSILMVAGLAHKDWTRKERKANKDLYFAINRDLAIAVAEKAIASGVGQFIYLSSMAVYGMLSGIITHDTTPSPRKNDYYGLSKYQAELALGELFFGTCHSGAGVLPKSNTNGLCIIRPPMVYGPNCPGNFPKLAGLAKGLPIFPDINNRRSMIYIDNLCAFIVHMVENGCSGVYLPQNREYVNTTELVRVIERVQGKRMRTTKLFNPLIFLAQKFSSSVCKLFGSLVYEHSVDEDVYNVVGFEDSIDLSVSKSMNGGRNAQ